MVTRKDSVVGFGQCAVTQLYRSLKPFNNFESCKNVRDVSITLQAGSKFFSKSGNSLLYRSTLPFHSWKPSSFFFFYFLSSPSIVVSISSRYFLTYFYVCFSYLLVKAFGLSLEIVYPMKT